MHLIVFIIYGSIISNSYQEIKHKVKVLTFPGINKSKTLSQIDILENKVSKLKKRYPFILLILLGIHLISCFVEPISKDPSHFVWAFLIAGLFLAFYFVVNFLKGAGTIDKNMRFDSTDNNW